MKKKTKLVCLAVILSLMSVNASKAETTPQPAEVSAVANPIVNTSNTTVNVSNQAPLPLVAPVVEDPKLKKHEVTKKIDLNAVIFDPDADFKAQAVEEGREMTKFRKQGFWKTK